MNTLTCIDGPNRGLMIERQGLPITIAIHGYWYERTNEKRGGRTCYRVQRNRFGEPTKQEQSYVPNITRPSGKSNDDPFAEW